MFFAIGLLALASANPFLSFLGESSDSSYLEVDGAAGVTFDDTKQQCKITYDDKTFAVDCAARILSCDNASNCCIHESLDTNSTLKAKSFEIRGERQWQLHTTEWYTETSVEGWTNSTTSNCAGVQMLGGYCVFSAGSTTKRFSDLPDHNYLRVKASFHFIDKWQGETGYLKLGNAQTQHYVWAERFDHSLFTTAPDLCGDSSILEGKFSMPIDITIEHFDSSVTLAFGSTLPEAPCTASFGVSSLQIYLR
jgi:hypothetical protein